MALVAPIVNLETPVASTPLHTTLHIPLHTPITRRAHTLHESLERFDGKDDNITAAARMSYSCLISEVILLGCHVSNWGSAEIYRLCPAMY